MTMFFIGWGFGIFLFVGANGHSPRGNYLKVIIAGNFLVIDKVIVFFEFIIFKTIIILIIKSFESRFRQLRGEIPLWLGMTGVGHHYQNQHQIKTPSNLLNPHAMP